MRSWVALVALGLCSSSWACGKSASNTAPGGAGGSTGGSGMVSAEPIPIEDLCPVFTSDLCIYLMQCNGARYRDTEHCERELDCYGLPQLLAAEETGAILYDPSKVGQCHARFLESPCTFASFLFTPDIYEVLAWCPGTVTPRLGEGQSCSSHGECVEGLYCYKGEDYLCPGTCRPFLLSGETCSGSARCAEGLQCNADSLCEPETAPGDACTGFCSYSVSCPDDELCTGNLWCDMSVGQCAESGLVGAICGAIGSGDTMSNANCAIHLWCDAVDFQSQGTCREPSAVGGPCNDELWACQDGLHCVGNVSVGTDTTLGTCAAPGSSDSECSTGDDCESEVCVAGLCAEPGGPGAECEGNGDCAEGLSCYEAACTDLPYPGESCSDSLPCAFSRCVAGTCEYHLKVGESCSASEDCATGACIGGICYDPTVCNAPP